MSGFGVTSNMRTGPLPSLRYGSWRLLNVLCVCPVIVVKLPLRHVWSAVVMLASMCILCLPYSSTPVVGTRPKSSPQSKYPYNTILSHSLGKSGRESSEMMHARFTVELLLQGVASNMMKT